ncbi:MAG: Uncharacterized protein Athens071425_573 [Parcubacteria group bacterium Athens0714_25]|nr:MAG: Uncharacterized protein Athens071425_573 [Parcubacteria group bacterium Athens0714_25]
MNISEQIKKIDLKKAFSKVFSMWMKYNNFIFVIFFVSLSAYGIFLMYQSLYNSNWDENQKNSYIASQQKNVQFKEDKFLEVVGEMKRRYEEYNKEYRINNDIFVHDQIDAEKK